MLMKDSFRSGTSDTALCQCGKAEESVEHFLFHCENFEQDRKVMMDNVLDIVNSGKSKQSLRITNELLLAPTFDDSSKRYNIITSGVYKAATYFVKFYIGFYLSLLEYTCGHLLSKFYLWIYSVLHKYCFILEDYTFESQHN